MSQYLTPAVKKQIIEHFARHDIDDMHQYAGAKGMLEDYDKVVDLDEVIRFLNSDLNNYISVSESIIKLLEDHEPLQVNLGQALHATQYRLLTSERELACHESIGVRLITALATKNEETLLFLINDPCLAVRKSVYENPLTPVNQIKRAIQTDIYFKNYHLDELEKLGDEAEQLPNTSVCSCSANYIAKYVEQVWAKQELDIPPIVHEFEKRLRFFGNMHFGTQPLPDPLSDYMFRDVIDYLKGPIPDQYVLSYAGHGISSYSLNFRYALGDIAVMMQVGYGGAYGDIKKDRALWNELVNQIGDIMLLNPEDRKEGLWQRKYLILFSNFRMGGLHLAVLENENWTFVTSVKTYEDLYKYFSFWGNDDELDRLSE